MIKIDKLLVLKAFYLGYEIRENHFNEAEALKMVNRAIDYYESQNRTFSKSELKRKLFYLLIKCELLRHKGSIQGIRALSQEFAKSINNTEMYFNYMKIIEETTLIHKSPDIVQMPEYKGKTSLQVSPSWLTDTEDGNFFHTGQTPFHALGIYNEDLSQKQRDFFYKSSILDIMKKHNIL
jgi:hypothetical protein